MLRSSHRLGQWLRHHQPLCIPWQPRGCRHVHPRSSSAAQPLQPALGQEMPMVHRTLSIHPLQQHFPRWRLTSTLTISPPPTTAALQLTGSHPVLPRAAHSSSKKQAPLAITFPSLFKCINTNRPAYNVVASSHSRAGPSPASSTAPSGSSSFKTPGMTSHILRKQNNSSRACNKYQPKVVYKQNGTSTCT